MKENLRKPLATLSRTPATISVGLVKLYQATLSPDHGPLRHLFPYGYCRHHPTCSDHAIMTLRSKPFIPALFLIGKRILSCNPWSKPDDERLRAAIRKNIRTS